jgi:TPR repeat protein
MSNLDSRLPDDFSDDVEITNTSGHLRVAVEIAVAISILAGIYFLFAPEETMELPPPTEESQIDPVIRDRIEAASTTEGVEEEITETPKTEATASALPLESSASEPLEADTSTQNIETARDLISKLRSGKLALSSAELIEKSQQFTQQGRLTDAYLLLFYAARGGDGQAAFALASLYDPQHFQEGNTLLEKPDVYQAHKWYTEAAKHQIAGAQERLSALRIEIERQADSGDPSAQRLLLNWQ